MKTIDLPESIFLTLRFADTPDAEPAKLDLMRAYDQAAAIQQTHGDDWLERWGEWIATQVGRDSLEYSEVRGLWEQVSRIAAEFLDGCKKKAGTIASWLCSMEGRREIIKASLN